MNTAPDTAEIQPQGEPDQPETEPIETDWDEVETYTSAIESYLREASWLTPADAVYKVHARKVAASLDRQLRDKGEVQSALASTFGKVLEILEKRRPVPVPDPLRDGVGPHGEKSLFGESMDG